MPFLHKTIRKCGWGFSLQCHLGWWRVADNWVGGTPGRWWGRPALESCAQLEVRIQWIHGNVSWTLSILLSYSLYPWCYGVWGLADSGDSASSANQLEITKGSFHMKTDQSSALLWTTFSVCSPGGQCSSPLVIPEPSTMQLRTAPLPQSLLTSFKLVSPEPAYLVPHSPCPAPFLPAKTTVKPLVHTSPPSFCLLADPGASPTWPCMVGYAPSSWEL